MKAWLCLLGCSCGLLGISEVSTVTAEMEGHAEQVQTALSKTG